MHTLSTSFPASCRASASLERVGKQVVDGRDIGERSGAVLRTAMPGHDGRGSPERLSQSTATRYISAMTATKRTIDVDAATAAALESRAAEAGLSVSELLADMVARHSEPAEASPTELTELDRQWAAIKAGELTVPHADVVRWLDTWGTPGFRP